MTRPSIHGSKALSGYSDACELRCIPVLVLISK